MASANKGGLSTREVAENIALPFIKQRAVNVAVSDETSAIEYDASLIVTGKDVTVTVKSATAPGIEIKIFCTADSKVIINNRAPENMFAGNSYEFFWNGSKWRVSDGVMTGNYIVRGSGRIPVGYLAADGQKVSEDEYPELYAEIGDMYQPAGTDKIKGSFYLPDLRECVPVGAGASTRAGIAAHDVYTVSQFKDDQFQGHEHKQTNINTNHNGSEKNFYNTYPETNSRNPTKGIISDGINGTPRTGTTTHGKQIGVNYLIKY